MLTLASILLFSFARPALATTDTVGEPSSFER
jgi:hypothetical protein